ncbi:FAD/NAD(P)-binding domain-containing protein [Annulohypoxylon maeteangense]|uniref:FAD/NAD(P)-binding domain-containing protein n=1 Tax=Annulohypoxylon maeteangense TaxID=1927788 RepID=UPI002007C337|nr:FAD/NAD(P)-binding domain-containing protein [Annulohypoxylon maeteangense]KAI0889245.1 FAD/NAD(P)-binding domain-containing protein [Annulohypoxylon maeteangense]
MTKTIVVLGGAYAGVGVAHRLLKHTKPSVKDLKVILVSKNSHFYWNLASVRAIVPGALKEEQYSLPIETGFAKYPADSFEFIVGSAEGVDVADKIVRVVTNSGDEKVLNYDHLVVATGTRAINATVPWKSNGTYEETAAQIAGIQDKVKSASHIVIAGAGATGVEAAAELAFEYGDKKEVVLLSGDAELLGGDSLASNVAGELKKLGVKVRKSARVTETNELPDGKTEVVLQDGEKISTDLYLPTMGVAPNTDFLPANLLTDKKFVDIDEFYKVKGAENVWAAGDAVWKPKGSFVLADKQAAGVAKNIDLALKGKPPVVVKTIPMDVLMVATGRNRGAGRLGPVKVFSIMVYMIKGKTLGTQQLAGYVDGSAF